VRASDGGPGYEGEFVHVHGDTSAVETVEAAAMRRVGTRDVPHVREMAA
jgi:hypothetical protein